MAPHYQAPNADALYARELGRIMMTRFYFHLTSKEDNIPDDSGKELDTLIDAYEHARVNIVSRWLRRCRCMEGSYLKR